MAQVSVQMAQDHIATAFHFLISKRLPPAAVRPLPFTSGAGAACSTSMSSISAILGRAAARARPCSLRSASAALM